MPGWFARTWPIRAQLNTSACGGCILRSSLLPAGLPAPSNTDGADVLGKKGVTNSAENGHLKLGHYGRNFPEESYVEHRLSNLDTFAIDAKIALDHAVALARRGITIYSFPKPLPELFPGRRALRGHKIP